jgi:pimeloyl-ACP methyl ester carboxylesterase
LVRLLCAGVLPRERRTPLQIPCLLHAARIVTVAIAGAPPWRRELCDDVCARGPRDQESDAWHWRTGSRDHGSVVWDKSGAVDNNLSIDVLSRDLVDMLLLMQQKAGWKDLPSVVLIGHSLGGAVVAHVANMNLLGNKLLGYAVLDVVEGSAMEALKHMQSYLATRPKLFPTLEAAIDWHIRSRTLRNPESARASVPSLLMQTPTGGRWAWKTELSSTESYWENWFTGLSGKFLSGKGAKLLLLAGTDRLDKELMIGQMQGVLLELLVLYAFCLTLRRQISTPGLPCLWPFSSRRPT